MPQSRCACSRVSRNPGISRYSPRIRFMRLSSGIGRLFTPFTPFTGGRPLTFSLCGGRYHHANRHSFAIGRIPHSSAPSTSTVLLCHVERPPSDGPVVVLYPQAFRLCLCGDRVGIRSAKEPYVVFIPRDAVLIDRDGREVRVVRFTRRLDTFALDGDGVSAAEPAGDAVRTESASRRMFRMTNEVDRLGRPILRESAE
jgi:hypothetical protein